MGRYRRGRGCPLDLCAPGVLGIRREPPRESTRRKRSRYDAALTHLQAQRPAGHSPAPYQLSIACMDETYTAVSSEIEVVTSDPWVGEELARLADKRHDCE